MTRSTFSLSIFAASAKGVDHVYETPKHHEVVVTSPTSSASRSSRLSNGFYRDSGNDSMYTSSGKNFFSLDLWHRVKKNSWRSYVLVLTIFFLKVFFREINFLTFLGGSTDSSNHQVKPISQRRHSETKWISGPSSHVSQSKLWMCYDWVGTLLWKEVKMSQIYISRIYKNRM